MRQSTMRFGGIMALLFLPVLQASALTVQIQLTPANTAMQKYAFQVTNEERDGMKQFGVTMTAKKEKLSPGLLARLHVSDGQTNIVEVPVEETREGDKVTYWFRVAPNLLAKSKFEFEFEFDVLSGTEIKGTEGKTRFVAEPGTIESWFYVGDFVAAKGVAAREKTVSAHPAKTHG